MTEPSDSVFAKLEYVGWIPTANGRLSFRHICDTRHPTICKYTNFVDSERKRHIAGFQRRDLSDLLFSAITSWYAKRSGDFWFTVACTSVGESAHGDAKLDALQGEVGIFKSQSDWKIFERQAQPYSLISDINAARLRGPPSEAKNGYEHFRATAAQACDVLIFFKILRNGEVRLGHARFKDANLEKNSIDYSSSNIGVPFQKWISDQAYFFLRDLCHLHQHHSPFEDTILILQDAQCDKRNWMDNVLYSLQHYVIKTRRSSRIEDLYRAVGVLSYGRAFEGVCNVAAGGDAKLQQFQFDAIEKSLGARIKELETEQTKITQTRNRATSRSASYRGATLAILAISCSALIAFMQPFATKHPDIFQPIGQIIFEHLLTIFCGMLALWALAWLWLGERRFDERQTRFEWLLLRKNFPYTKDILVLGMFRPKLMGAIFLSLSMAVFLVVFLYSI